MKAGHRKTLRRANAPLSVIVRYDLDLGQWIHSAGLVLSPRESAVMAALAHAGKTNQLCVMACCSSKAFDNTVVVLKRRFHVNTRSQLTAIAAQLFPPNIRGHGRTSNREITLGLARNGASKLNCVDVLSSASPAGTAP